MVVTVAALEGVRFLCAVSPISIGRLATIRAMILE